MMQGLGLLVIGVILMAIFGGEDPVNKIDRERAEETAKFEYKVEKQKEKLRKHESYTDV